MIILFFKDPDKFIRDVACDLYRRALDECPVIGKYLISDPYYPVGLFYRIVVVYVELTSEIKEKDIRIRLYVVIRDVTITP